MVNSKYNLYIAQLFGSPIISELASKGTSGRLNEVVQYSGLRSCNNRKITYKDLFARAYKYLQKNYRSEYLYKNNVARQLLLKRHSLQIASLLSEFRVGESKADVVILNGTSTVYEIKTDYDNFDRLDSQLLDYSKVFDKIYVVLSKNKLAEMQNSLPPHVGIILLKEKEILVEVKEAQSNKINIIPDYVINSLRKNEIEEILQSYLGYNLNVPNTQFYSRARALLNKISPVNLHYMMLSVLRDRNREYPSEKFIQTIPCHLKFAGLTTPLNQKEQDNFQRVLVSEFRIN